MTRARAGLVLLGVLAVVTSCAPLPPPAPSGGGVRPVPQAGGGSRPSETGSATGGAPGNGAARGAGNGLAAVDSTPSREALEVLESIPEPLPPGERVPPPEPTRADSGGPGVADSLTHEASDSAGADVPVPEPTLPLGQRPPPSLEAAPDSSGAAGSVAQAPAPTGPPKPPTLDGLGARSQVPDTCWRVQVAAPANRAKAERMRQVAESVLLVSMRVEPDRRLFKVRSRDCLERSAADRLRQRAAASGFAGAFRFSGDKP